MWFLQRKSDGQTIYLLNREYVVGRRKCTIEVSDDLSVSRQHLKLSVDYSPLTQLSGQPSLKIMDLGSTYGVFVNPSANSIGKVDPHTWVNLEADSSFHFGVKNEWKVKWKNISVVCSALGSADRRRLNKELNVLGAESLAEWQHGITHLVTDKIMLTQKVLDSLLAAVPIVVVEFFEKWVSVLEQDPFSALPDASLFTPQIGQALGQFGKECFTPIEERKSLFLGSTFIFASPSELKSSMAIAAKRAGGNITSNFETFNTKGSLLMESANHPPEYARILAVLLSRGERSIPPNEIGLAILSCSVQMYCNPRRHPASEQSQNLCKPSKASIQCSLRDEEIQPPTQPVSQKRDGEEPPSKRNRIENPTPKIPHVLQPPTKRIHLDDEAATICDVQPSDENNDEVLKRKSVKARSELLRTEPIKVEATQNNDESSPPKLRQDFVGRQPPITSNRLSSANVNTIETRLSEGTEHMTETEVARRNIPADSTNSEHKTFRPEKKLNASDQFVMCREDSTRTSVKSTINQLKSLSKTTLDDSTNDWSRSQWHGCNSPGKLNTSKLIVKTNLVRPELNGISTISQKSHSQFKEVEVITRIKSMKIACLKEGKWITR